MPDQTPLAQIVGQTESMEADTTGRLVKGYRVTFRTKSGHTGSVFVPAAGYNRDNVLNQVRGAAMNMEQIGSLQVP